MPKKLTEQDRIKLDGIIQQMVSNGETDDDIKFVVEDFKGKYGVDEVLDTPSPEVKKKETTIPTTPLQPKTEYPLASGLSSGSIPQLPTQSIPTVQGSGQSQSPKSGLRKFFEQEAAKVKSQPLPEKKKVIKEIATKQLGFTPTDEQIEKELAKNPSKFDESIVSYTAKESKDKEVETASVEDIYISGNNYYSQNKADKNALSAFDQSRKGKIFGFINDVNKGEKISNEDDLYWQKVSPNSYNEMLEIKSQKYPDLSITSINTVADLNKQDNQIYNQKAGYEQIQKDIQQASNFFDVNKLGTPEVTQAYEALDKAEEAELKSVKGDVNTSGASFNLSTPEFRQKYIAEERQKEDAVKEKFNELRNKLANADTYTYAIKNPEKSVLELGEHFMELVAPSQYANYIQGGKTSTEFKAQASKIGSALAESTGNAQWIEKSKIEEDNYDNTYPQGLEDEVRRRIGIEFVKQKGGANTFLNGNVIDIEQADAIAEQLPKKYKDYYTNVLRPKTIAETTNISPFDIAGGIKEMIGITAKPRLVVPPIGGVIDDFYGGISQPIVGIGNTISNVFESKESKANRALKSPDILQQKLVDRDAIDKEIVSLKEIKNPTVDDINKINDLEEQKGLQTPIQNVFNSMSNLSGQVAGQAILTIIGGGLISGASSVVNVGAKTIPLLSRAEKIADWASKIKNANNVAGSTVAYLSSYDDANLEAQRIMPNGNFLEQQMYAQGVAGLNAATERIFKDEKIFDAFKKEIAPQMSTLVKKFSSGAITEAALSAEFKNIVTKTLPKFLGNIAKENQKESAEEVATAAGTTFLKGVGYLTGAVDKSDFNLNDEVEGWKQTWYETTISGLPVSVMAGVGETRRNAITQKTIYELARNKNEREKFIEIVRVQQQEGKMTVAEATEKIQAANTLGQIYQQTLPLINKVKPLNQREAISLTSLLYAERKLNKEIADPNLSDIKSLNEKQLKEVTARKDKILNGEAIVDKDLQVLTPEEWKQKNLNEEKDLAAEIPQGMGVVEANGKFTVKNPSGTDEIFDTRELADARVVELSNPINPSQDVIINPKGKDKIKEYIDSLAKDNYLFTHVTTESDAQGISGGNFEVSIGTGISSSLTQLGSEGANQQIERLMNGEVVHRDKTNNSVAIIAVPKSILDGLSGKDKADALENWLAENGHINGSKYSIPSQFNAGYLSGDTFIQNKNTTQNDTQDNQTTDTKVTTDVGQSAVPQQSQEIIKGDTKSENAVVEVAKPISAKLDGKDVTIEKTESGYTYTRPNGFEIEVTEDEHLQNIKDKSVIVNAEVGSKEVTPTTSESGSPTTETAPIGQPEKISQPIELDPNVTEVVATPTTSESGKLATETATKNQFDENVRQQVVNFHDGLNPKNTTIEAKENRKGKFNPKLSNGKSDYILAGVEFDTQEEANNYISEILSPQIAQIQNKLDDEALATNTPTEKPTVSKDELKDEVTEEQKMQFGKGYKDYDFAKADIPTNKIKITEQPSLSERKELVDDIKENGIKEPIIAEYDSDSDTYLVKNGNNRAQIAKDLGIKTIPTIVATYKESVLTTNTPTEKPKADALKDVEEDSEKWYKAKKTIKDKDGNDIKLTIDKNKDDKHFYIKATDSNGKEVGSALFETSDGEVWSGNEIEVNEANRRKGIMSAMYDFAESEGHPLEPTKTLSKEGKAFWDNRKAPTQYTEAATPAKKESAGVSGSALKDAEVNVSKIADEYLYHGTGEGAFRRIREEGLVPQGDKYLYFADIEQYARTYAQRKGNSFGDRILRVKKSDTYSADENTTGGDFKTKAKINPNDIEIKHNGKWVKIQEYSDENIGIMPIPKAPTQYTEAATPAKKESEGVSGSALKDVVRQESDAEKLNKEAGVDIYVARQDIDTNGGKYTLSQIKENGNTNTFLIEDAKGNEVGKAQLSANGNYLENIRIDEKHRRKGLASKVYDFIELRKGIELEPSPNKQSKEAKALWDKRNLQKSVSNKANGGLLAKALGESMSKTFADFRNKQQVLLELENKYFEQKGLSKEEFNKLSENEKSEIIKDAIKWKNDNPELVKAVESALATNTPTEKPTASKDELKDVEGGIESTAKNIFKESKESISEKIKSVQSKVSDAIKQGISKWGSKKGYYGEEYGDQNEKEIDIPNYTFSDKRNVEGSEYKNDFDNYRKLTTEAQKLHELLDTVNPKLESESSKDLKKRLGSIAFNFHSNSDTDKILLAKEVDNILKELEIRDEKVDGEKLLSDYYNADADESQMQQMKNNSAEITELIKSNTPTALTTNTVEGKAETPKSQTKNTENEKQQPNEGNIDQDGNIRSEPKNQGELAKIENEIARIEENIAEREREEGITTGKVAVADIIVQPKTFQFKATDETESGVNKTEKLQGTYDRNVGGTISVWKDTKNELGNGANKIYVVDGHHRLDLAKRSGTKDLDVFFIEAETAKDARLAGARANIAQGRGTSIDSAKIFRESPDKMGSLKPNSKVGKEGEALSKLNDNVFELVATGKLPIKVGIALSQVDKKYQTEIAPIVNKFANNPIATQDKLNRYARKVQEAIQSGNAEVKEIQTLFGAETQVDIQNSAIVESEIINAIKNDARLFSSVKNNKEVLENANNQIDVETATEESEKAKKSAGLFDTFRTRKSVSDIYNKAVADYKNAKTSKQKSDIISKASTQVKDAIQKELDSNFETQKKSDLKQKVNANSNNILGDYDGIFSTTKTGISGLDDLLEDDGYNYFYKGKGGEVVMMSPDDYLKRVREGMKLDKDKNITDEKKQGINKAIDEGNKINMPFLSYRDGNFSQEGRNRAVVAKERGEKLIPVFIEKDISFNDKIAKGKEYINTAINEGATTKQEVLDKLKKQGLHRDAIRFIDDNFDTNDILKQVTNEEGTNKATSKPKKSISKEAFTALTNMLKKAFPKVKFIDEVRAREILDGTNGNINLEIIHFLKTENGQVFGFQSGDEIFLDPELMNADTPIHEVVGHYGINIIDALSRGGDAKATAVMLKGFALLKEPEGKAVLDEVQANPAYANLPLRKQKLEALATIIGREGASVFDEGTKGVDGMETLEERIADRVYKDPNTSSRWRIKGNNYTYSSKKEASRAVESEYKRDVFAREQSAKNLDATQPTNTFQSKVKAFINSFYEYIKSKLPTLKDKSIEDIGKMDNKEFIRAIIGDAFRGEIVADNETLSGDINFSIESNSNTPISDKNKKVIEGLVQDIKEGKRTEQEVRDLINDNPKSWVDKFTPYLDLQLSQLNDIEYQKALAKYEEIKAIKSEKVRKNELLKIINDNFDTITETLIKNNKIKRIC